MFTDEQRDAEIRARRSNNIYDRMAALSYAQPAVQRIPAELPQVQGAAQQEPAQTSPRLGRK